MKIKVLFFVLSCAAATSMHARKPVSDYSLPAKQAALQILKNPELRKKVLEPQQQEKSWWQTVTGWLGL